VKKSALTTSGINRKPTPVTAKSSSSNGAAAIVKNVATTDIPGRCSNVETHFSMLGRNNNASTT